MSSPNLALVPGDDPRDASAEVKFSLPETWRVDNVDSLSSSMMFVSPLIMVTRNRYLAWPVLLLSINSVINSHPLRTKDGGGSASVIILGVIALLVTYIPLVTFTTAPKMSVPIA